MIVSPMVLVVVGSLCAAAGQIYLKLGATGATSLADYVNPRLGIGFGLYAVGSVLWVVALSKLPLSRVYPFTVLTFVLVYVASFAILGERISGTVITGALLVLAGLIVIATA
jgi:drug/metabolite transporter (DMT)-like permease